MNTQQSIRDVLEKFSEDTEDLWEQFMEGDDPDPEKYDQFLDNAYKSATQELLNIINGLIPEEHVCTDECKINSREWIIGHKAYKDAEHNIISEIRERLKG